MSRRSKKKRLPENRDLRRQDKTIHGAAVCGFLLLIVVLVFGQTFRHGFVNYDDSLYVYENPQVAQGLTIQGIAWAFTSNDASNWHPLTWLSHMLDCQLYGLLPGGHHLTNVLLHAATAIVLFLVLRRMTGDFWPSAFVSALFAIHPLRVESVAWVAERKDVLSGLLFMLTLWAYVGYVGHRFSHARYLSVLVFFAFGLMAKPMLVTAPFVLLLLDYWPLGRMAPDVEVNPPRSGSRRSGGFSIPLRLLKEKVPLLLLAAASCAITLHAQRGAISTNEHISFGLRMGNVAVSYVTYLGQLFYPKDLAVLYPFPTLGLPLWKVVSAIVILAAICCGVVVLRRRCPYLPVGWFWYVGMLAPVIGLVQVGSQSMADRYTYLPQIGLYIAIAWGVMHATRLWPYRVWICGAASSLVLAACLACAWRQTSYWSDSQTLWTHTLSCTSQNYIAHINLGNVLGEAGRLSEAIEHYQQALRLRPDYPDLHYNLGKAFLNAARPKEAIEQFEKALRLKNDDFEAHNNLGIVLGEVGRLPEAIEHYHQALRLKPNCPDIYYNLAITYAKINKSAEASSAAQKALDLARSTDQKALAKHIENWLNSYRADRSADLKAQPPSK